MDQQVYISCSSLDLWVPWSKMAQQEYEKRGLLHFYERARAAKAKSERKRTQVGLIGPHHPAPSDGIVCVSARSCPGWREIIAS